MPRLDTFNSLWLHTLAIAMVVCCLRGPLVLGQVLRTEPGELWDGGGAAIAPLGAKRVMHTFDFEERRFHFLDLPMNWHKVSGKAGFPHYSSGSLDSEHQRGGHFSFKLVPDGGSIGFEYDRRGIQAESGSDFQITGYVRIEHFTTAKVQMTCALTDRRGEIISGSGGKSRLVGRADGAADDWIRLEAYVPGNFPEARFVTVGLWVLQEDQWDKDSLAEPRIGRKDVHAVAWFDDITIYQLPRVILKTDRPGNVFAGQDKALLLVEVQGVGSTDYEVRLTVRSAAGELIKHEGWILTGIVGTAKDRTIELPSLPAGLYRAELAIMSDGVMIARRQLAFCRLAKRADELGQAGDDFGIVALDQDIGDWDTVMTLTRLLNTRLLKLPVWRRRPDEPGAIFSAGSFDRRLIQLQRQNIEMVATFSEAPDALALQLPVGQRSLLDVLSQDISLWREQVAYVLVQYAHQVPYWQVGADVSSENQHWDPRIRTVVQTLDSEFEKIVRNTVLAVPLSNMFQVDHSQVGTSTVALAVSSAVTPEQIPYYLQDYRDRGFADIWVTIEPLDELLYPREYVLIDLAKRIAQAKVAMARAVFIDHPWRQRKYNARIMIEPTEAFAVFRTLAEQLGGASYVGQFHINPDIVALIFERNGGGCLLAWNNNYDPASQQEPEEVRISLGDSPAMLDLFGNRSDLPTQKGLTSLRISHWPVLITDIDTPLAVLRATLSLTPDTIAASISRQYATLKFANPFNVPISGRLRFLVGEQYRKNWQIHPQAFNFVLQPRQVFEQELTLKFPRNELGGRKRLDALFSIDADRTYRIRTSVPFEIRLAGIDVSIFTHRVNQTDMLVQLVVTNEGEQEVNLNSFVDLPDGDRQERAIARLQPGASIPKSFHIPQVTQWYGKFLRIGLEDPKGTRRINYHIEIN